MNTMDSSIFVTLLVSVLICNTIADEKLLSGEPVTISKEGNQTNDTVSDKDVKPKSGERSARFFTFSDASQQQDSRTHESNFGMPPSYETTQKTFHPSDSAAAVAESENRPLNFLPYFGHYGMQNGHPFFKDLSANELLASSSAFIHPIVASSDAPYGSTIASPPLPTFHLYSAKRLAREMATAAAMIIGAFLYPKVSNMFRNGRVLIFREGRVVDDLFHKMGRALEQFDIDGESCMKLAFCSLGNSRKLQKSIAKEGSEDSTYADVLVDISNLPPVRKLLSKRGFVHARNFGESGGDCDYFNIQKKCPIGNETFKKYLSFLV